MSYSDTIKRWRELTKSAALAIQSKGTEQKESEPIAAPPQEPVYSLAPEDEIQSEPELPFPTLEPASVKKQEEPKAEQFPPIRKVDTVQEPVVSKSPFAIDKTVEEPAQWVVSSKADSIAKDAPVRSSERLVSSEIQSALGAGTMIEGKFTFDKPVRIDGHLIGEVNSSSTLVVGDGATVDATINVGSLLVYGKVSGKVLAQDAVQIMPTGTLEADIRTKRLIVNEGAIFRGGCNIR